MRDGRWGISAGLMGLLHLEARRNLRCFSPSPSVVLSACLAVLSTILLAGCGEPATVPCFPVKGQVFLDGQPLSEAEVVFHPQLESAPGIPRPIAYTDSEGRFELTTIKPRDGAPPGKYAVTVVLRDLRQVGEELIREGDHLLPARYADPESSGFQWEVVAGTNAVPPLQLTTTP